MDWCPAASPPGRLVGLEGVQAGALQPPPPGAGAWARRGTPGGVTLDDTFFSEPQCPHPCSAGQM